MWNAVVSGFGHWVRSGMDGLISGLDIAALLNRPTLRGYDPVIIEMLLSAIEAGALQGQKEQRDNGDS